MNFFPKSFDKKPKDEIDHKFRLKSHFKDFWTVLHVSSVYLPSSLSQEEQKDYNNFVDGLIHFGTKADPAIHDWALTYQKNNKFNFSTRDNAALWLCKFHNSYNLLNNKYLFECTIENLTQRYGNATAIQGKSESTSL